MIQLVRPSRGHVTQFYAATQVDGNPHAGQDYAYTNGVEIFPEVYAAADGVVLFAGDARGLSWPNILYLNPDFNRNDNVDESAGNYTILGHYAPDGRMIALTGYGHQENIWVKAGDTVLAGQRIGTVGDTGFSAGKHLHFDFVLTPFRVNVAPYYGRVDPNPHFTGSLTPAGTITPLEDDFMALFNNLAEFRQAVADVVQPMEDTTRQYLKDRITENGLAVLNGSQAQEDVTRDYLKNQTQAQSDVTRQYLADRIRETSPAEVVALIPDELVQAFLDELSDRLAGKG